MRIDSLYLENFRCYKERRFVFHPNVNLVVGFNASGKTALLDAVAIAIATWLIGFKEKKLDGKSIAPSDATLKFIEHGEEEAFESSWPVVVSASGYINNKRISWQRSKASETGNTRYGKANELIDKAKEYSATDANNVMALPLIANYGTMRLWQDPRATKSSLNISLNDKPSRLDGYKHSVDPRIAIKELVNWFARQEWKTFQQGKESTMLKVVREAVLCCIEGAVSLRFDAGREELMLRIDNNDPQPFYILSDGQRCLLALVADIAQKAATLNPHLGSSVLKETQGVVLIDELDLHLHPHWQRKVIEDLRTIFPKIQFIFTTHSPFLIQSLRSGDELLMLDGEPTSEINNKTLEDIAVGIMQAGDSQVSDRYDEMKGVAIEYLKTLSEIDLSPNCKLEDYKDRLANSIAPYADNPAYQAFLEMQRIAKLGE